MSRPWKTRTAKGRLAAIPTEHQEQARLIQLKWLHIKQYPELANLFAIPGQAVARLKNIQVEGYQKGLPDLMLAWPCHCERGHIAKAGLFVELKRLKGGKIAPEQYEWLSALSAAGYVAEVAYGCDGAWAILMDYLQKDGAITCTHC